MPARTTPRKPGTVLSLRADEFLAGSSVVDAEQGQKAQHPRGRLARGAKLVLRCAF
jgi:hypothetical protein